MNEFNAGDTVVRHWGMMAGEQGQMFPSYWPMETTYLVIEVRGPKLLVQNVKNGEEDLILASECTLK